MAQSNFNTNTNNTTTEKAKLDKNLGIYIFVDEYGNVTQIPKAKKVPPKYYPNDPSKVDSIVGDVFVIGVDGGEVGGGPLNPDGSTVGATITMGIGDATEAYAKYN